MKYGCYTSVFRTVSSPSMRREWIEISILRLCHWRRGSPSMRREWIEMNWVSFCEISLPSPSMRREWIEISNDAKAY